MANPALLARVAAQIRWPGAVVVERGRGHIKHRHPTESNKFMLDTQVGGAWHYGLTLDQEVDTAWEVDTGAWQYKMVKAGFNAFARNQLGVGDMLEYRDPTTLEYTRFQPLALNWVNDNDSRQQITQPQSVMAQVNGDILNFPNGYGTGRHFQFQVQTARLQKLITIDSPSNLPAPTVGGTGISLEIEFILSQSAGVSIWVDGVQWDRTTKTNTANRIEYRLNSNGQVIWCLDSPRAFDSAGNVIIGWFQLRRQGANRYVTVRVPKTWIDTAVFPIMLDPTVDEQVGASAQDAYKPSNGNPSITDVQFTGGNYAWGSTASGAKFTGITLSGTVSNCYLTITVDGYVPYSGTTANWVISADDNATPADYTTTASNWTDRTQTTATVTWSSIAAWDTADVEKNTPDISPIIQELIDTYTYNDGTMAFRVNGSTCSVGAVRSGYSYDGSTTKAPKLHVEYTAGGVTLAAALSFAGVAQKQNQQREAGVLSFAGVAKKSVSRTLASALSFGGDLASQIISGTVAITLTAALSFAGVVTKTTSLVLSGASSFSGALGQQGQRVVSGVLSFGGAIGKAVSANTASALSFGSTITKATATSLAGALSFGGNLTKQGSILLGGVASFAGSIGQGVATTVSAALSFGGEVIKQPSLALPSALSFVGTISKVTTTTLSSALSFTGNLVKTVYLNLAGALSFEGVLGIGGALLTVTLAAALSFAGALTKATSRTVDASLTFGGAVTKTISQTLTGVLSWVGDFAKWVTRHGNPTVAVSNTAVATLTLSNSAVATLSLSNAAVATLTVSSEAWV